jgi:hypothetical protein
MESSHTLRTSITDQIPAKRNACRTSVGKPEGKRLLRPGRRWMNNIDIDEMVWNGLIWLRIGISGGLL